MILRSGLAATCLALGAGGAAAYDELPRGLARLTPAEVISRIQVDDEALEPDIVVSTRGAWDRGRAIEGAHARDVHLRALVNRKTGVVRWQVWHDLVYNSTPSAFVAVDYRSEGRIGQAKLARTEHWRDDCPTVDAAPVPCNRYDRFVFELPEQVVQEIAANYRPDSRKPWRLRFKDERGGSITGGLAPAEAAGLVTVVQKVRREQVAGG